MMSNISIESLFEKQTLLPFVLSSIKLLLNGYKVARKTDILQHLHLLFQCTLLKSCFWIQKTQYHTCLKMHIPRSPSPPKLRFPTVGGSTGICIFNAYDALWETLSWDLAQVFLLNIQILFPWVFPPKGKPALYVSFKILVFPFPQ